MSLPVHAEEIAFAMTLFVSAANGQAPRPQGAAEGQSQPGRDEFEQLFLDLSLGTQELRDPARCKAALSSSVCQALRVVWDQYAGDVLQRSICARVLSFCYLMEETHGDLVAGLVPGQDETEAHVVLHPAVIEAVARTPLSGAGLLSRNDFTQTLNRILSERGETAVVRAEPEERGVKAVAVTPPAEWPRGEGEMAERIRMHPWTVHALGDSAQWPQSLRTAVDLMLACRFPMIVLWGEKLLQLYNDGYRDVMGRKHPGGLGQTTAECWAEVWNFNQPVYEKVMAGESLTFENQLFPINRYGYLENAYFTLCYSPLRGESGEVAGVLVTVFETTSKARLFVDRSRPAEKITATGGMRMQPPDEMRLS